MISADAVPTPASDLEIWLRFAGTLSGIIITGLLGYWGTRKGLRRVEGDSAAARETAAEARDAALTAAGLAEPTGNGFAATVLGKLDQLAEGQAEQSRQTAELRGALYGHISDHASADVRGRAG